MKGGTRCKTTGFNVSRLHGKVKPRGLSCNRNKKHRSAPQKKVRNAIRKVVVSKSPFGVSIV